MREAGDWGGRSDIVRCLESSTTTGSKYLWRPAVQKWGIHSDWVRGSNSIGGGGGGGGSFQEVVDKRKNLLHVLHLEL